MPCAAGTGPSIPAGHRIRKRDGKIVKHSNARYHLYKLSRRKLKKNRIYYYSTYEDRPHFDPALKFDWVQVRKYQTSWLLKRLTDREFISEEVSQKVNETIESVLVWILSNTETASSLNLGTSGSWVATLALHYMTLNVTKEWAFENQDFVHRFNPSRLWDIWEHHPPSEQRDGVFVVPLDDVRNQLKLGADFERLLHLARSGTNDESIPELMDGLSQLNAPKKILYTQFGKEYV